MQNNIICSYNPTLINKDDNKGDHGRQWVNGEFTVEELMTLICVGGYAISSQVHNGHRTTDNFLKTNIIMIDVDNGMSLAEALSDPICHDSLLAYYISPSCTEDKQKFRLIFKLPFVLQEGELVSMLRVALNDIFNGDTVTTDPCRLFYGNNSNLIDINNLAPLQIYDNELTEDQVVLLIAYAETIEPAVKEVPYAEPICFNNEVMSTAKRQYLIRELKKVDLSDYGVWRNLACAMQAGGMSVDDYHSVSQCSKNECIKTWNSMAKDHSGKKITAGTLWYMVGGRDKYNKARATGEI